MRMIMSKRKKKSSGFGLFVVGTLLVVGVACAAYYAINTLHWGVTPPKQKPAVTITPGPALAPEHTVYLYLVKQDKRGFHLGRTPVVTRSAGSVLDAALNAMLATNKQAGLSAGLIPEGTKLLSPIQVEHGVATANLSQEFVDNFSGGTEQEAATVNSIAHTLVSNSGGKVHSVHILVEGKKVESLGGHFVLTDPVSADSAILRPGSLN